MKCEERKKRRKKIPGLMVHLCEGERFLVVEEEIVLLLLVIFPNRAPVQQLGHLIARVDGQAFVCFLKFTWSP